MAENDTTQGAESVQAPAQQAPAAEPGPIPYSRFKEVNDQLAEMKQWRQQQEAAQAEAQRKQLEEQGKWKELAEKHERELLSERLNNQRIKIASAKGLPVELADRLQGKDEAELAADADRIIQFLKPASGPGVTPPPRGGQQAVLDPTKMTYDEYMKNRDKIKAAFDNQ